MTRFDTYIENQEALLKTQKASLRAQETQLRLSKANARQNAAQIAQQQRMIGRLDDLAQEARRQTELHEELVAQQAQAHADQLNFQFKMWRQTEDGKRYLAWESRTRAFVNYLQHLQGEFSLLCSEDVEQTREEVRRWSELMRARQPTALHRFRELIIGAIVVFPLLLAVFFPKINHGFGRLGGFFATAGEVITGAVVGVLISSVAYVIYAFVAKRVICHHAKAVLSEVPDAEQAMASLKSRFVYFFTGPGSELTAENDFLDKVYRNDMPPLAAPRSFCDPDVLVVTNHFMSIIQGAPQNLPVDLPEHDMPGAVDPSYVPEGTGAHAFVRAYARALESQ
ncbi:hypothetical protein ACSAGD_11665 [Paramicrobacterium sp. CJ85]|uniref:hypothetical protein n=1 Tax=Paramicrobacterium sp. CJ85 TaxID=3445355 RepID=UPI003F63D66C